MEGTCNEGMGFEWNGREMKGKVFFKGNHK
jgi:hypothetical protein